jgi:hypothetical protein
MSGELHKPFKVERFNASNTPDYCGIVQANEEDFRIPNQDARELKALTLVSPNEASLPPDSVRKLLEYDASTGLLTWLPRPEKNVSARIAGKTAGSPNQRGYIIVTINGCDYQGHRVAWVLHYGRWPAKQIDHINGNKGDNRICNLREVTQVENSRNAKLNRNNTSGHCGVLREEGKWTACIMVRGRLIRLGTFKLIDDAVAARKQAERKYGFHENHGRSAGNEGIA